jgi:hypothetical protein
MSQWGVSAAGRKKGIFWFHRAKTRRHKTGKALGRGIFWIDAKGVSRTDQCYEPAGDTE